MNIITLKRIAHRLADIMLAALPLTLLALVCRASDMGSRGWATTWLVLLVAAAMGAGIHYLDDAIRTPRGSEALARLADRLVH